MEKAIHIQEGGISLEGILTIPEKSLGIVLFAHGSGSSRFSPRNTFVAKYLNKHNLATLLIDLLSPEEDSHYETRFDISLLTKRLIVIIKWLKEEKDTNFLSITLFGSSTGAAAALETASLLGYDVKAVVSRGGRPDLAIPYLDQVKAPTLFIVGGNDFGVIELNEKAYRFLKSSKDFKIIPNATHLFEEPGCLEEVANLAKDWLVKHLS